MANVYMNEGAYIDVKGFGAEESESLKEVAQAFAKSYSEKPEEQDNGTWLESELKRHLVNSKSDAEISQMKDEILESINNYNQELQDLRKNESYGKSRTDWLQERLIENTPGDTLEEKGERLADINDALTVGNALAEEMENATEPQTIDVEVIGDEIEELQKNREPEDWNDYSFSDMAENVAKQAELLGLNQFNMMDRMKLVANILDGDGIPTGYLSRLETGSKEDVGVKALTAGALVVGAQNGLIPILPKETPIPVLASVASGGVEVMSTMARFAQGEAESSELVDAFSDAASAFTSLAVTMAVKSTGLVTKFLGVVPYVGPVLQAPPVQRVVATVMSAKAPAIGKKVGNIVRSTIQKAKPVLETALDTTREVVKAGVNMAKETAKKAFSFVKSLFS